VRACRRGDDPALRPEDERQRAAAIASLSSTLAEPTSTSQLEEQVVQRVSELVGDAAALWRRDDEGHIELRATTHRDPARRAYVVRESPGASHSDTEGVLPHVWRAGTPVRLGPDELATWLPVMQPAYQAYAARFGLVSLLLVPLRVRGRVVAVLGVSRDEPPLLDDEDERFVAQIGAVIAVALDNDRLLRQARSLAVGAEPRAPGCPPRGASPDALTGLPNRRLLLERLHAPRSRATAGAGAADRSTSTTSSTSTTPTGTRGRRLARRGRRPPPGGAWRTPARAPDDAWRAGR
jgi:hypothetical protein